MKLAIFALETMSLILSATAASGAVHRLQCSGGHGTAISVGKLKDGRTVFFTADHCIRGNPSAVFVGDGKGWTRATVVDRQYSNTTGVDLAILTARCANRNSKPCPVSGVRLGMGDKLIGTGYAGSNGQYTKYSGTIIGEASDGQKAVWMRGQVAPKGNSGGPVWNTNGEVVGIMSATRSDGESVFTSARFASQRCSSLFGY